MKKRQFINVKAALAKEKRKKEPNPDIIIKHMLWLQEYRLRHPDIYYAC